MPERRQEQLLLGYIEGDLNEVERREVLHLFEQDPELAGLIEGVVSDREVLSALPDPAPPSWLMDEVDRHLERAMLVDVAPFESHNVKQRQRHVLHRLMVGGGIAAMVALVASVIYFSVSGMDAGSTIASLLKSGDSTETPPPPNVPESELALPSSEGLGVASLTDEADAASASAKMTSEGQLVDGNRGALSNVPAEADGLPAAPVSETVAATDVVAGPESDGLEGAGKAVIVVDAAAAKPSGGSSGLVLTDTHKAPEAPGTPESKTPTDAPVPLGSLVGAEEKTGADGAGLYAHNTRVDRDLLQPEGGFARTGSVLGDVTKAEDDALQPVIDLVLEVEKKKPSAEEAARREREDRVRSFTADPSLAKDYELRVISGDLVQARSLIQEMGGDSGASVSSSRFMNIKVAVGALAGALDRIEAHASIDGVALVEREVFAMGQVPGSKVAVGGRRVGEWVGSWPAIAPDYEGILLEQLPTESNAVALSSKGVLVELAVEIVEPGKPVSDKAVGGSKGVVGEGQKKGEPVREVENARETPPLLPSRAPVLKLRESGGAKGADEGAAPGAPDSGAGTRSEEEPRLELNQRSLIEPSRYQLIPPVQEEGSGASSP